MDTPLDRITIHDLTTRTFVGFNPWEREKMQEVRISVSLYADLSEACRSDRVEDSVDYKAVKTRILALVENNRFDLIEKMAQDIAEVCLAIPRVERADVIVNKGGALRFARSVEAAITRFRCHD